MNLTRGFEELMVAISFAEADEHKTSMEIMNRRKQAKRKERATASRRTALQRKELRLSSISV